MLRRILKTCAAIGLVATACGNNGAGAGGAGGTCGAGPWSYAVPACSDCMSASCCRQLTACDASAACSGLFQCVRACPASDAECVDDCWTSHVDGQAAMTSLVSCYDSSCKSSEACSARVCGTGVSVSEPACSACLTASCCDSWAPCVNQAVCLSCLSKGGAGCEQDGLYTAALQCQMNQCGEECATRICDTSLGYPNLPACNACMGRPGAEGGCCEQVEACAADQTCLGCVTGQTTAGCDASNAAFQAFSDCESRCADPCGG